jgi:hypothetical protein
MPGSSSGAAARHQNFFYTIGTPFLVTMSERHPAERKERSRMRETVPRRMKRIIAS